MLSTTPVWGGQQAPRSVQEDAPALQPGFGDGLTARLLLSAPPPAALTPFTTK